MFANWYAELNFFCFATFPPVSDDSCTLCSKQFEGEGCWHVPTVWLWFRHKTLEPHKVTGYKEFAYPEWRIRRRLLTWVQSVRRSRHTTLVRQTVTNWIQMIRIYFVANTEQIVYVYLDHCLSLAQDMSHGTPQGMRIQMILVPWVDNTSKTVG